MDSSQPQIFEGVSHLVQSAIDGYNVCIFAYGQTGSGKTFTMYGKRDDQNLWGIAPRAMKELYELIENEKETTDISVSCYMLELYNDQLVDLLIEKEHKKKGQQQQQQETKKDPTLAIKLDSRGVVVVQGALVRGPCNTFDELYKWNELGMDQRHVASTAMNAESSRSHLVFSILIEVSRAHLCFMICIATCIRLPPPGGVQNMNEARYVDVCFLLYLGTCGRRNSGLQNG
jgi:kinesin family protein C2/C3